MPAVIKPPPLRAAVEGGFTLDDFTIDLHTRLQQSVGPASPLTSTAPASAPAIELPAFAKRVVAAPDTRSRSRRSPSA